MTKPDPATMRPARKPPGRQPDFQAAHKKWWGVLYRIRSLDEALVEDRRRLRWEQAVSTLVQAQKEAGTIAQRLEVVRQKHAALQAGLAALEAELVALHEEAGTNRVHLKEAATALPQDAEALRVEAGRDPHLVRRSQVAVRQTEAKLAQLEGCRARLVAQEQACLEQALKARVQMGGLAPLLATVGFAATPLGRTKAEVQQCLREAGYLGLFYDAEELLTTLLVRRDVEALRAKGAHIRYRATRHGRDWLSEHLAVV